MKLTDFIEVNGYNIRNDFSKNENCYFCKKSTDIIPFILIDSSFINNTDVDLTYLCSDCSKELEKKDTYYFCYYNYSLIDNIYEAASRNLIRTAFAYGWKLPNNKRDKNNFKKYRDELTFIDVGDFREMSKELVEERVFSEYGVLKSKLRELKIKNEKLRGKEIGFNFLYA